MALLEVKDLEVTLETGQGTSARVIEGVSFSVDRGDVFGVVGESGCGKSMTALALMRLLPRSCRITGGQILLDGVDLVSLPSAEMRALRGARISMIFQDSLSALNPVIRIGDQIAETLRIHEGMGPRNARRRALDLLKLVGISDAGRRLDQHPHELSGGMRQRVMIAMALACNPMLLIADEPTTALDVTIQAQILALIRDLRHEFDMGIVFITHDLGVIAQFAERVMVMYAGQVVEQATVTDIFDEPAHPYTQALIRSIPNLSTSVERLADVAGTVPPVTAFPKGCRFATRCAFVRDRCRTMPDDFMTTVADGHRVACIRHDELEPT